MSTDHPADRPFSDHRVTRADYAQLIKFWFDRSPLPRPLRKRMEAIGMLHPGTPTLFTHSGTDFMREHAPRSTWPRTDLERKKGTMGYQSAIVLAGVVGGR